MVVHVYVHVDTPLDSFHATFAYPEKVITTASAVTSNLKGSPATLGDSVLDMVSSRMWRHLRFSKSPGYFEETI